MAFVQLCWLLILICGWHKASAVVIAEGVFNFTCFTEEMRFWFKPNDYAAFRARYPSSKIYAQGHGNDTNCVGQFNDTMEWNLIRIPLAKDNSGCGVTHKKMECDMYNATFVLRHTEQIIQLRDYLILVVNCKPCQTVSNGSPIIVQQPTSPPDSEASSTCTLNLLTIATWIGTWLLFS
ncbi:uncharacterized protein LOC106170031 [Lingula anatina]|uniref:Uncharacterized protein LOC106170031 n=1 Tax=Lingula anatina TaxID=7574 RepID=A0A1S3J4J1_LINAN|nr:uncharacterized protein LOC106170031 [Lingula anatina]|eukprot:XP_013405198.1 uncharacterized protein LOC106170031 [Lingula anatina]